jgi:hypothetical protein
VVSGNAKIIIAAMIASSARFIVTSGNDGFAAVKDFRYGATINLTDR